MEPEPDYFIERVFTGQKLIYSKLLRPVSHEKYKAAMLSVFEKIQKYSLENWVMDSTKSNFTMQDQKWSVEQLGLLLQGTPLCKVAMVRDNDAILQVVAESMRTKVYRIFGKKKELQHFKTLEEALQYVAPNTAPESLIQAIHNQESEQS